MNNTKKPEDYPCHNDKDLPDWFKFGYYEDLAKIEDISFWAFQFAIRAKYKNKEDFITDTGGTVTNDDGTRLSWKNGVLNYHSPEQLKQYIDGYEIHYLKKHKGKLIPDGNFIPDKDTIKNILNALNYKDGFQLLRPHGKILTTEGSPLKSLYQKVFNQPARHEFPDKAHYEDYRRDIGRLNNTTVSFLVNLKMPTSRIIKELESQIEHLKKKKRIVQYKGMKKPQAIEWSEALAVWDLWIGEVKPRVIQNRVLALWHPDFMQTLGLSVYEKPLENKFDVRKKIAKKMIEKEWRKLAGHFIDP